MPTAIVTSMPSCPYCGLLFRTGEDYDDHKPCSESPEAKQRTALRQRVSDIQAGAFAGIAQDRAARFWEALDDVFGTDSAPYGIYVTDIDSITDYLWQKGVRA